MNKSNRLKTITILVLFSIYWVLVKVIRPYCYESLEDLYVLNFVLGILPNFLGALLLCITLNFIPKLSQKAIISMTMGLVIFMETERYYNQNIPFDIYDIIASLLGVLLWLYWMKNIKKIEL